MSREHKISIITAVILLFCAVVFTRFLEYREVVTNRSGILIDDPLFKLLPLQEHSNAIFAITYGAIILYIAFNFRGTGFAARAILSYAFVLLLRIPSMLLVPLKVHPDLIFLKDPFLNELIYPSKITNDLFFSGHVALMCIFILLSRFKWIFVTLAAILASLLLMQRVHYTIDILGAVPFAWMAVRLSDLSLKKIGLLGFD